MADQNGTVAGKVAVVTGGNRGLGLEACRQLARAGAKVVLASRDPAKGRRLRPRFAARGSTSPLTRWT